MTLREVQALLLLFRSCQDDSVRRRALTLVPELEEWIVTSVVSRRLIAYDEDDKVIAAITVNCDPEFLDAIKREFALKTGAVRVDAA